MPFIKETLEELLRREDLSYRNFAKDLAIFAESIGRSDSVKQASVGHWMSGLNSPRMSHLDLLYLYAQSKGHHDLIFYGPPKKP